jgi:alditol oxidase
MPVDSERVNWAGNVTFSAARIHRPTSLGELRALVASEPRVRALGTRHSFSDLADSPGALVSLAALPPVVEVDPAAATARVPAGMRYAELGQRLAQQGWALHNLGSLPHISVAGACATATHGSGVGNGNLATAVRAVEMVTAGGDIVTLSRDRDGDRFHGAVVALGAIGVVTHLWLDLQPYYTARQNVFEGLPLEVLAGHAGAIMAGAYSVSLFTDWRDSRFSVWFKQRDGEPGGQRARAGQQARPGPPVAAQPWFAAQAADRPRHPIPGLSPGSCTEQLGVPGPWFERLPHFRPGAVPSAGHELQSEYLLPSDALVPALRALDRVRDRIHPVLQVCEVRTVAADRQWLSPSYARETAGFHFTWIDEVPAVMPVIKLVEAELAEFQPRPHWGKVFAIAPAAVAAQYERLADFQRLMRDYDPAGKFANAFTRRYLGGG